MLPQATSPIPLTKYVEKTKTSYRVEKQAFANRVDVLTQDGEKSFAKNQSATRICVNNRKLTSVARVISDVTNAIDELVKAVSAVDVQVMGGALYRLEKHKRKLKIGPTFSKNPSSVKKGKVEEVRSHNRERRLDM